MKGASIATNNSKFNEWAYPILKRAGKNVVLADGVLQLAEGSHLITIYADKDGGGKWGDLTDIQDLKRSDLLKGMSYVYLVDCRWEQLFCDTINTLAKSESVSFVVIDNGESVLLPGELDAKTISL